MSISPEDFRAFGEARLKEMIATKQLPTYIVATFVKVFDDEVLVNCSVCDVPVYISPSFAEVAKEYSVPIVCGCCVDPQEFRGQMVQDVAKIEQKQDEELWEEHLKAALTLFRDIRAQALAMGLDPKAFRVALKYAMLSDNHFMKPHLTTDEEDKIEEYAQVLFSQALKKDREEQEKNDAKSKDKRLP